MGKHHLISDYKYLKVEGREKGEGGGKGRFHFRRFSSYGIMQTKLYQNCTSIHA